MKDNAIYEKPGTYLLTTRKYEKETYKFILEVYPRFRYIKCETPINYFCYPDTIILTPDNKQAYTLHRYIAPWKLKKIEKVLIKLTKKYCDA